MPWCVQAVIPMQQSLRDAASLDVRALPSPRPATQSPFDDRLASRPIDQPMTASGGGVGGLDAMLAKVAAVAPPAKKGKKAAAKHVAVKKSPPSKKSPTPSAGSSSVIESFTHAYMAARIHHDK